MVNEIAIIDCTKSIKTEDLEINDVLESIEILLKYIKKRRRGASLVSDPPAKGLVRAMGGWGKHTRYSAFAFPPPKNPLSRKSLAFEFLNLTLHARSARGFPQNQWLSLLQAKQEIPKIGDFQSMVALYNQVRTYFTQNPNS